MDGTDKLTTKIGSPKKGNEKKPESREYRIAQKEPAIADAGVSGKLGGRPTTAGFKAAKTGAQMVSSAASSTANARKTADGDITSGAGSKLKEITVKSAAKLMTRDTRAGNKKPKKINAKSDGKLMNRDTGTGNKKLIAGATEPKKNKPKEKTGDLKPRSKQKQTLQRIEKQRFDIKREQKAEKKDAKAIKKAEAPESKAKARLRDESIRIVNQTAKSGAAFAGAAASVSNVSRKSTEGEMSNAASKKLKEGSGKLAGNAARKAERAIIGKKKTVMKESAGSKLTRRQGKEKAKTIKKAAKKSNERSRKLAKKAIKNRQYKTAKNIKDKSKKAAKRAKAAIKSARKSPVVKIASSSSGGCCGCCGNAMMIIAGLLLLIIVIVLLGSVVFALWDFVTGLFGPTVWDDPHEVIAKVSELWTYHEQWFIYAVTNIDSIFGGLRDWANESGNHLGGDIHVIFNDSINNQRVRLEEQRRLFAILTATNGLSLTYQQMEDFVIEAFWGQGEINEFPDGSVNLPGETGRFYSGYLSFEVFYEKEIRTGPCSCLAAGCVVDYGLPDLMPNPSCDQSLYIGPEAVPDPSEFEEWGIDYHTFSQEWWNILVEVSRTPLDSPDGYVAKALEKMMLDAEAIADERERTKAINEARAARDRYEWVLEMNGYSFIGESVFRDEYFNESYYGAPGRDGDWTGAATSPYGYRNLNVGDETWERLNPPDPIPQSGGSSTGLIHFHWGIDVSCPNGTQLYALGDGIIVSEAEERSDGDIVLVYYYNLNDENKDGLGPIRVKMNHLDESNLTNRPPGTRTGDTIRKGQLVAYSNDTGSSSGPHLHIEMQRLRDYDSSTGTYGRATQYNPLYGLAWFYKERTDP